MNEALEIQFREGRSIYVVLMGRRRPLALFREPMRA